jgi:uncharacterized OsmC-like protein
VSASEPRSEDVRRSVKRVLAERSSKPSGRHLRGVQRASLTQRGSGNGPYAVRTGDFEFVIDEPEARGGSDAGANPLQHIIAGAAGCYLSHLMLMAIDEEVDIELMDVDARGVYERAARGGAFEAMDYRVEVQSRTPPSDLEALADRAQHACYAHNTLRNAGVELTVELFVNGEHAATLKS